MAVIKHSKSSRLMKNAMVLDLGDLQRQGERILERAHRDAEAVRAEARAEAQRLIDAADARGYEQGCERGEAEGRRQGRETGRQEALAEFKSQFEDLAGAWQQTLADWQQQRNTMLLTAREDVLSFAFALGEQIVRRVIEYDPTVVQDQLAEALNLLAAPTAITVHVHPEDRELIEEALPRLLANIDGTAHAEVNELPEMHRGGCRISFSGGHIDASIERQIERLAQALLPWADPPVADPIDEEGEASPPDHGTDSNAAPPQSKPDSKPESRSEPERGPDEEPAP